MARRRGVRQAHGAQHGIVAWALGVQPGRAAGQQAVHSVHSAYF